ncbi:MAG: hypothetical protein IKD83_07080 [Firmicutes bacterium]|nr:hypothetical protein [Bacillota bacterium]
MKKIIVIILIIFSFFILSGSHGCRGPQYDAEEKTSVEQSGREQMQGWLDEHIPGAEVLSAEAYIDMIPSGPHYLTNSVYGTFSAGDKPQNYVIETDTAEVFLETDISPLREQLTPYVLEALGLENHAEECSFSDFNGYIPQNAVFYSGPSENTGFLPGELVLDLENASESEARQIIDAFIRDPENRPDINISGDMLIPEDVDLKTYNMAFFEGAKNTFGLYFNSFYMNQEHARVSALGWYTDYERYVRKPFQDFFVEYEEESISDKVNNGKIEPMENYTNDVSNLEMFETDEGYGFRFKDPDNWFMFRIIADENSKLFPFSYTDRYDQAANIGNGSYGGNRYIDHEVRWEQLPDGYWTLNNEDGTAAWFSNADELITVYPER